MKARVMLSSVIKDKVTLGKIPSLEPFWYEAAAFTDRLEKAGYSRTTPGTEVDFSLIREELLHHLEGKYSIEVYAFELAPGPGRPPETETVSEAFKCHLVIGLFGSKTGWKVGDQDPLTPTLREWRAALQTPLKFRVFWLKGSTPPEKLPGELGSVMRAISDYKKGKIYWEFSDAVDLFSKIDRTVQDYLNRAIIHYAIDTVAKEPTTETEEWLLSPYRTRHRRMLLALQNVSVSLGIQERVLPVGTHQQPVSLHCVPDSFSIPESRKFAAYVFDDEAKERKPKELGKLHFIAVFGTVTDLQVRRHLGNLEAAKVYSASWGFFASEPSKGVQCVYLPRCTNSLRMQSTMSQAISWLSDHSNEVAELAELRAHILDLLAE